MDRDRNLLFGVFAVQLRKATPSQIMAAAGAWAADPAKDLPAYLEDLGAVSSDDRRLLANLVEQAVSDHGGDVAATLVSFGGAAQVERSFYGSVSINARGEVETVRLDERPSDTSSLGVEETPGRYSQIGETARGGMGRILLVHDEFLGRDVALKELLPGLVPAKDAPAQKLSPAREGMSLMARFLQEARITGQLEHPSIVPVYELGHRADGTIYYTMKLVRGETLDEAIRSARNLQERLGLLNHFIDLCQGIAYAHSLNVIHRDIKPSNVMVGKFGETVVLDWGLAKVKDKEDVHSDQIKETLRMMNLGDEEGVAKTAYGEIMGTPLYMPPEQAKGQLDQVDERSDVYSLGAVLYEILTGQPLFEPGPIKHILSQVIEKNPRRVRDIAPEVPVELASICETAICHEKQFRYESTKDLANEITRFVTGGLVRAHKYGPVAIISKWAKSHAVGVSALVATLFAGLLVSGSIITALRAIETERFEEVRKNRERFYIEVRRVFSRLNGEGFDDYPERDWYAAFVNGLNENTSPEDSWYFFNDDPVRNALLHSAGSEEVSAEASLAFQTPSSLGEGYSQIRGILLPDVRALEETWNITPGSSCFSSDETRFVLWRADGTVAIHDFENLQPVQRLETGIFDVLGASISQTGSEILVFSPSTARLFNAVNGEELFACTTSKEITDCVLSPNSRHLAIWAKETGLRSSDAGLRVIDVQKHSRIEIDSKPLSYSFLPGSRVFREDDLMLLNAEYAFPYQWVALGQSELDTEARLGIPLESGIFVGDPYVLAINSSQLTIHEMRRGLFIENIEADLKMKRTSADSLGMCAFSTNGSMAAWFAESLIVYWSDGDSGEYLNTDASIASAQLLPKRERLFASLSNGRTSIFDTRISRKVCEFPGVVAVSPSESRVLMLTQSGVLLSIDDSTNGLARLDAKF